MIKLNLTGDPRQLSELVFLVDRAKIQLRFPPKILPCKMCLDQKIRMLQKYFRMHRTLCIQFSPPIMFNAR
jgi:hypothetical protein